MRDKNIIWLYLFLLASLADITFLLEGSSDLRFYSKPLILLGLIVYFYQITKPIASTLLTKTSKFSSLSKASCTLCSGYNASCSILFISLLTSPGGRANLTFPPPILSSVVPALSLSSSSLVRVKLK